MNLKQRIRSVTGGLAVVVLLALVVVDIVYAGITVTLSDKLFVASVASALLGVDFLFSQGPLNISISRGGESSGGGSDNE